jgi:diguanylate cyclase (GGDEF)-like protein
MKKIPIPENDELRLAALEEYEILDTPYEEIFDNITQLAATITGAAISQINLIDRNRLWVKSTFGLPGGNTPREITFCGHTILGNDMMEVVDALSDERFLDNPLVTGTPNIRFYAGMPLTNSQGFNLGALCVVDSHPKNLTSEQKEKVRRLSKIVMALFEARKAILQDVKERERFTEMLKRSNQRLEETLLEQKNNLSVMQYFSQMNGMLQCCISNEEANTIISNFCQKIFPTTSGALYLSSSGRSYYELFTSWNKPQSVDDLFATNDCWALRRSQIYFVEDVKNELVCNHLKEKERGASLCLPLIALSETIGLLCIEVNSHDAEAQQQFNAEPKRLLAIRMAEQIALSLANIQLRQTLRDQSICDPLTKLYNRRYFIEMFNRELPRAIRKNLQFGIVIIDVDHFKKFNDTYGHDAGDMVLQAVSDLLKQTSQQHDIACRWGGEEFALFIQDTSAEKLKKRLERLKHMLSELSIQYEGKTLPHVTVSQGVALFPLHGNTLEKLISAADSSVYQAKNNGRDRIVFYAPAV